jgi:opacity protein-like surface antigen
MRRLFAAALILASSSTLSVAQTLGDADAVPSDSGSAAALPYGLFVSPAISTLGLGLEGGARLNENFGLRVGGNWLGFDYDDIKGELDYDAEVTLASLGALVDYHPFGGGFRLSGGLRFNFNKADLDGTPTDDIEIGDQVFSADEVGTLTGDATFDTLAPYLGIGYGATLLEGSLSIGFDLGVMYQGQADVDLDAESGLLSDDAVLQENLAIEEDEVEDDLEDFIVYPVIGLAVIYRF